MDCACSRTDTYHFKGCPGIKKGFAIISARCSVTDQAIYRHFDKQHIQRSSGTSTH